MDSVRIICVERQPGPQGVHGGSMRHLRKGNPPVLVKILSPEKKYVLLFFLLFASNLMDDLGGYIHCVFGMISVQCGIHLMA